MDAAQFGELLSIPSENSSFTLAAWKLSPKFRGIGSVDKVRGPFSFRRNVRVSAIFSEKKQRFEKFDSLGNPRFLHDWNFDWSASIFVRNGEISLILNFFNRALEKLHQWVFSLSLKLNVMNFLLISTIYFSFSSFPTFRLVSSRFSWNKIRTRVHVGEEVLGKEEWDSIEDRNGGKKGWMINNETRLFGIAWKLLNYYAV